MIQLYNCKHAHALIQLYDKISNALDNKRVTLDLFIDLSKAFDTVNREILLDKLEHYGVSGIALQWFESYLSCRKQFVQYNCYNSSSLDITCGVHQRSILGPLLFLVYINDLCNVSKVLEMILFADDPNIFYWHTDVSCLMEVVNLELKKITCWFCTYKLSINVKKSNFIIFRPKFLGVILDEHLTWKSHIHNVARKVSKAIGITYKSSFRLNNSSLRMLYFSLIYPYLFYCVSVWAYRPTHQNSED